MNLPDEKIRQAREEAERKADSWVRKLGWKLQHLADHPNTLVILVLIVIGLIAAFFMLGA